MIRGQFYLNIADLPYTLYLKEDWALENNPHFHSAIEFIFIKKGSVKAHIGDYVQVLEAGDLCFASSYDTHFYETLTSEVSAIVIVASIEFIESVRAIYPNKDLPTFMLDKEINKEIQNFLEHWLSSENKTPLTNIGFMNLFFSNLIDKYQLVDCNKVVEDDLLKRILMFIHEHYLEEISLNQIAHEFGFTVEYCSKTLKKATKCNFRQYLNLLRLRKAKSLLEDRTLNMTTSEVLYSCGFSSVATYYRVKKQLGF